MKLLLKYKDQIVSLGLLPLIATLIGLHFLPSVAVLGGGLILSILSLLYYIIRLKELNFFLLLSTIGIGTCYLLREFTDYQFLPQGGITPTLELILLIFAFIHITAPEIYKNFQQRLKLKGCFSYLLEAKTIVVLSTLHLAVLGITIYRNESLSEEIFFFLANIIPVSIYIICLIMNVAGICIALQENFRYTVVRIAPICHGKIYLSKRKQTTCCGSPSSSVWDLPVENSFEGPANKSGKYAKKVIHKQWGIQESPRLLLHYKSSITCSCQQHIHLYIVPVAREEDLCLVNGKFFSFEEIMQNKEKFGASLLHELSHLQLAAHMWDEYFYTPNQKSNAV